MLHPGQFEDILISTLADAGFESFETLEATVHAYIPKKDFDEPATDAALAFLADEIKAKETSLIPHQNWNETWEKSYGPVFLGTRLAIVANFHDTPSGFDYVIRINPEMSFGTGHHATTQLMAEAMLGHALQGREVFDFGAGTGILAILAAKMGASKVYGVEIDAHATKNACDNAALNGISTEQLKIETGELDRAADTHFDFILGNINRNVLCENMLQLSAMLRPQGTLLMSGFYETDIPIIVNAAEGPGLQKTASAVKDGWACVQMKKL